MSLQRCIVSSATGRKFARRNKILPAEDLLRIRDCWRVGRDCGRIRGKDLASRFVEQTLALLNFHAVYCTRITVGTAHLTFHAIYWNGCICTCSGRCT